MPSSPDRVPMAESGDEPSALSVAFVGKGGAGKSTIAGTFARLLARSAGPVLAVDSDPMPGLAYSLGADVRDDPLPDEITEENDGPERPRFRLRAGWTPADIIERYAPEGPDGVRLLQFGKLRGHVSAVGRSQHAFRAVVADIPRGWHVVGDLPGGTRQPFMGWVGYASTILVVVEPTPKSFMSGRRLARLASARPGERIAAVASKVREASDTERVAAATGLEVVGCVPADPSIAEGDRLGLAPLDHAGSAFIGGVGSLVDRLLEERVRCG